MSPIDALADAIMNYQGWRLGSRSYRNRNPGNLRGSPYKVGTDDQGYAIFRSLPHGYDALVFDLTAKITGRSSHKLGVTSTLLDLVNCYAPAGDHNEPSPCTLFVVEWLCTALDYPVHTRTSLGQLVMPWVQASLGTKTQTDESLAQLIAEAQTAS